LLRKVDLADTNRKKSRKLVKMDQMMIDLEREVDPESTLVKVLKASVTPKFDDF
jgi:hypothetical protein